MNDSELLIWEEEFPALCLKGEGVRAFLHGQTTADVLSKNKDKNIFKSCWLSTKGTLKALLEIRLSNNMADILIICGEINSIKEGFESVIFPADKVNLEVVKPIKRVQKINNFDSWKDSINYWLDFDNKFLIENKNYKKVTQSDLKIWKMRQGIPCFGKEINGEANPYELGLGDIVKLDKGCYLGQEAMARFFRSKSLKYHLRFWKSFGENSEFNEGKKIFNTDKNDISKRKSGVITSSINIKDNEYVGLALIKNSFIENDCFFSSNGSLIYLKKPISFTQPYL